MFIYLILEQNSMDILDNIPTQLQQQSINQSEFLDKSEPVGNKQESSFISSKQEQDFLSGKPDSRSTDFFSFSAAEKQKQKEARAQISPEVS